MEIKDLDWNSFMVSLPRTNGETQDSYLRRANECLNEFYKKHTTFQAPVQFLKGDGIEALLRDQNFCYMFLEKNCNVKYNIVPDGYAGHQPGIHVFSHKNEDDPSFKEGVDFLREKWRSFEF